MMNDPVLRMLGLARRAGKLAFGDELVREACMEKKARCVMAASDAGESTAKKAAFYADVSAQLAEKNARIQSRRGKKKPRASQSQAAQPPRRAGSAPRKANKSPRAKRVF